MIICGNDLCTLVRDGIITNVADRLVNAGSIDITCGEKYIAEMRDYSTFRLLEKNHAPTFDIPQEGIIVNPNASILLESEQMFNLPERWKVPSLGIELAVFAEYKLKSTMARNFVDAFNAGWCDAGWHGARLTIELTNRNMLRSVCIKRGDAIGQMIFYAGTTEVDHSLSYRTRGRYNNTLDVTAAR